MTDTVDEPGVRDLHDHDLHDHDLHGDDVESVRARTRAVCSRFRTSTGVRPT